MRAFLLAGLITAIGVVAWVGSAHADSRYCRYNAEDPRCSSFYDRGGYGYDDSQEFDQSAARFLDERRSFYDEQFAAYDEMVVRPKLKAKRRAIGSCAQVGRALRDFGFRRVLPIDCDGKNFKYAAFRGYQPFIVRVDRFNGRIREQINY